MTAFDAASMLPPRFVRAEIVTCGFTGTTVEVVVDMSRVVTVTVKAEALDGDPPVELTFVDGQTQRVCGTPDLWRQRLADAQRHLDKD